MSDLELSDNEMSDIDDVSDDESTTNAPTFKKTIKNDSDDEDDVDFNDDENDEDENDDEDNDNGSDVELDIADGEILEEENIILTDGVKNIKKGMKSITKPQTIPETTIEMPTIFDKNDSDYESDEDEDEDEDYLQKFDKEIRENYILNHHSESQVNNYDEIYNMTKVQRNKDNVIIDELHKTVPILTKFEKTKILGVRAKQLNNGAKPMITLKNPIIDGYLIALKELEEKKIPVIIRRPLPNNTSEYWNLKDLEII
jgi:DNA-directed RNA polymerase I, II, and III subunit RPABC2